MNHDKNSISLNRGKNKKGLFLSSAILFFRVSFFRSYSPFSEKGTLNLNKVKDYFVLDSYLLNRWIGGYSGSESGGVLLHHFYQLKVPIRIPFMHRKILLNNLHNLYYESFVYLGVPNYPPLLRIRR